MSGIAPNPLNAISKVYLETIANQQEGYKPIDKKKETAMYRRAGNLARTSLSSKGKEKEEAQEKSGKIVSAITKQKEDERFERIGKDPKHQNNYKESLDPVGQEDADIDNDGDTDKSDKYLHKRRKAIGKAMKKRMKEEKELAEITKMAIHAPHEVPSGNLKGLVKKAVKRIDADNDGDVDKDDPKETGMGEFVPSPDGKKKIRTSVRTEGFSNWRTDLAEVMDDETDSKQVKEKKVNNKIKINPTLGEALEEIGATLIEMVEVDEFDYVVESVYDELLEEGYEEDDIEEAIEYALTEAKVTYGHDTTKRREDGGMVGAVRRLAKQKLKSAGKAARYKAAKASVDAYAAKKSAEYAVSDATRKAKRTAEIVKKRASEAPKKVKSGVKGFIKKQAEKVAKRMSEETQIDENVGTGKAKRAKFGGVAQKVGKSEVVTNKEKGAALEKHFAAKKAAQKKAGEDAHKAASAKGLSPAEAEMRRKAAERKAARMRKEEVEQIDEKALSKAQQRFMGAVYAAKKGATPASPEIAKAAASMTKKQARDFAKTKHKGLPEKKEVKEAATETPAAKPEVDGKKSMMDRQKLANLKMIQMKKQQLERQKLQMQKSGKLPLEAG